MDQEQSKLKPVEELEELEEIFREEGRSLLVSRLSLGLMVGVPLYLTFTGLDWIVTQDAETWRWLLFNRLFTVLFPVLGIVCAKADWFRRHIRPLSVFILWTGAMSISAMTVKLGGFESPYFMGLMLMMFLAGLFCPWGLRLTAAYGAIVMASYVAPNMVWTEWTWSAALLPLFFLAGTVILTCWAADALERHRRSGLTMRLQLSAANDELMELDEAKSRFFANVSHELRTPLTLILSPIETMLSGEGDANALLRTMNTNAHRLLRQVNMILNFSKIEAGQQDVNREMGAPGELLQRVVEAAVPYAEDNDLELRHEGLGDLPQIPFDEEKIETVAANLLSNAMKFTPKGGSVSVRGGRDKDGIWFEVEDTGCGIPKKDIKKIFEAFHQVDGGKGGKTQGTGLGLPLAKELVELHGGALTVRSVEGEGTTFRATLPDAGSLGWTLDESASTEKKEDKKAVKRVDAKTTQFSDLRTSALETAPGAAADGDAGKAPTDAPQLLVVEDNPDMRGYIVSQLRKDYRVASAVDGEDGIEQARRVRPDLIISDVMMPKMNGFEMVGELRKDGSFNQTPIIMLTARTGTDAVVEGLNLGAVDYVAKPFKLPEIKARIAAQLRMRSMERTLDERDSRLVAVGQMTGTIAHDMRSPLTAIFNRLELLRVHADLNGTKDTVDEELNAIERAIIRIRNMITELLDFVRGANDGMRPEPTPIGSFLDSVKDDVVPTLEGSGIEFVDSRTGDMFDAVELDADRLRRVLENLVNNARDAILHSESPGDHHIWMSVDVQPEILRIRVADDGPGIPKEIADSLFQPFQTAGKPGGTGLGLVVVRNLLKAHGGDITVDLAPEEGGAAFELFIPRDVRVQPNYEGRDDPGGGQGEGSPAPPEPETVPPEDEV